MGKQEERFFFKAHIHIHMHTEQKENTKQPPTTGYGQKSSLFENQLVVLSSL